MKLTRFFVFLGISVFLTSCSILNFQSLKIDCSISEDSNYFDDNYIRINFNFEMDSLFTEEIIKLMENDNNVELDFLWNGTECVITPKSGWQRGSRYKFIIEGTLRTLSKGSFTTKLQRIFYYGNENESFCLEKCSITDDCLVERNCNIIFSFNKKTDEHSFIKNFNISPYTDYKLSFGDKIVSVIPTTKWNINTYYKWSIENVESTDGILLDKKYQGTFYTDKKEKLPELIKVCTVQTDELSGKEIWQNETISTIKNGQNIGFEFSQKVKKESVEEALKFEPSINGRLEEVYGSEGKKFIYKTDDDYSIGQVYHLTVDNSVEDENEGQLFEKKEFTFTCTNDFLEIVSIRILKAEGAEVIYPLSVQNQSSTPVIANIDMNAIEVDGKKEEIKAEFSIEFSSAIPKENRKKCMDNISLTILFPISIPTPVLQKVKWNEEGLKVNLEYSGFTESDAKRDCYYQFYITGGKKGCKNYLNEYMEKDLCSTFLVL